MKLSIRFLSFLFISLLFAFYPARVQAQAGTPGNGTPTAAAALQDQPKGTVTGKIFNKNDSSRPVGDLEVVLHVLDQDMNQLDMLHGKSGPDGSFKIADVAFRVGINYVAAVTYEGTTYYSDVISAEDGKTSVNLEVVVYESTPDLSMALVEQMHVLFGFTQDGLDVKELYVLSNLGDRTIKGGVDVPENNRVKAAVRFFLPEKADFINFQPKDDTRFLKYQGGFADANGIVPGRMVDQFMVNYLMPYATPSGYSLRTTLAVQNVNFVVPRDSGVILKGQGLGEAQSVTAQDGQTYDLYKLLNVPAGQTLEISINGKPNIPQDQANGTANATNPPGQFPLFLGLGLFGLVLIGGGAFWWVRASRKSEWMDRDQTPDEQDAPQTVQEEFDDLLTKIAQLDQDHELGKVEGETYQNQRAELMSLAKSIQNEQAGSAPG